MEQWLSSIKPTVLHRQSSLKYQQQNQHEEQTYEEKMFMNNQPLRSQFRLVSLEKQHRTAKNPLIRIRNRKMNPRQNLQTRQMPQVSDSQLLRQFFRKYNPTYQPRQNNQRPKYNYQRAQSNVSQSNSSFYHRDASTRMKLFEMVDKQRYHSKHGSRRFSQAVPTQTESKQQYIQGEQPLVYFPIIKNKRFRTEEPQENNEHRKLLLRQLLGSKLSKKKHETITKARRLQFIKRFRIVVLGIIFTFRLKSFGDRIRPYRKHLSREFCKTRLQQQMIELKTDFVYSLRPLLDTLVDHFNTDLNLSQKDDFQCQNQKIHSTKRLLSLSVECIRKCIDRMLIKQSYKQLLYFTCKHGNFGCLNYVYTPEEMMVMSISEQFGCMHGDNNLQKSALTLLVLIKVVVFNILVQPQKINWKECLDWRIYSKIDFQPIYTNFKLVGNILYELLIQVQDELLEKSGEVYVIGNWKQLKQKFSFRMAQSMIVQLGIQQGKQLISGLLNHKYVQNTYQLSKLSEQRREILQILNRLHRLMVSFHQVVIQKCWGQTAQASIH